MYVNTIINIKDGIGYHISFRDIKGFFGTILFLHIVPLLFFLSVGFLHVL